MHSAAQVTLSETVPRSQPSISVLVLSSPSPPSFDTAFLSQRQQTRSTVEHSIFEANYISVTSNEVALDEEEMDNFLPDAHWTSSRVVSPVRYITPSPLDPPQ
ncbi:rCG28108, partial [Rattus norvegicus]